MTTKELYRTLVENAFDGIYISSPHGFEFVNPAFEKLVGFTLNEICRNGFNFMNLIHPDDRKLIQTRKNALERNETLPPLYEFRIIPKEGGIRYVEVSTVPLNGSKGRILGLIRDTTRRKHAELALYESEEKYRYLVERANEGIAIVQEGRFQYVNPKLLKLLGYSMEEVIHRSFTDLIQMNGLDDLITPSGLHSSSEEANRTCEVTARRKDSRTIPLELNAGIINYQGKPASLIFFRDITERKHAEEELNQTLKKLRKAIGATIQAITKTVEIRDPYTAGHQRRVADLARAIATRIGLSKERIDGLRMAASIHDIGKISVPSEILSKPGKINDMEFTLIKTHPQVGYDILKSIESPWPLAQIVLQHHERLDGSGYPQGLKKEDILFEAKILGVADVVEAMVSHRPYRTAHKLESALEEISSNRGILYDPLSVDVCLELFQEKKFFFK